MTKQYQTVVWTMLVLIAGSCTAPTVVQTPHPNSSPTVPAITVSPAPGLLPERSIVRYPATADLSDFFPKLDSIPEFDPASPDPFQVDLRSQDLSVLDLTASRANLMYASFDSKTKWPSSNKMPEDFDWQKIMETSKDPGLGIRALHDQGIAGKGVGIAIIDQTLLVDHGEYKDRLRLYEEMNVLQDSEAAMHGAAVASIAVGKTVGVAPEADLYYIATGFCGAERFEEMDFACWADAVRRIVEINKHLPVGRKIRVLSLS